MTAARRGALAFAGLVAAGVLLDAAPARACSCDETTTVAEAFESADAVFFGRVVVEAPSGHDRSSPDGMSPSSSSDLTTTQFMVIDVYKGPPEIGKRFSVTTDN